MAERHESVVNRLMHLKHFPEQVTQKSDRANNEGNYPLLLEPSTFRKRVRSAISLNHLHKYRSIVVKSDWRFFAVHNLRLYSFISEWFWN